MRHDESAGPTYSVRQEWDDAIAVAAEFWKSYDHKYDSKADVPFKAGEGYDQEVYYRVTQNKCLYVMHAGGEGPCIRIERAKA